MSLPAPSPTFGARWGDNPHNFSWHHTMLRIKNPEKSLAFYRDIMGMTVVSQFDFPQWKFSLYFLATLPEGTETKQFQEPTSDEAHQWLWNTNLKVVELTHNHGDEAKDDLKMNNGNVEPNRGFGHIAFNTVDVYGACDELEAKGVAFQKKPNDGRMKGLAFALDPDGYWIEIVRRESDAECGFTHKFNLSQTMIRVKDPKKSIPFYRDVCGMSLVRELHFPKAKFSLYFMANLTDEEKKTLPPADSDEANNYIKRLFNPVLELTHNHGTEDDADFSYHNGNEDPKGFGHLAFLVDDIDAAVEAMEKAGTSFKKKPNEGSMKGIAFAYDPDNYWVELVPRGFGSTRAE